MHKKEIIKFGALQFQFWAIFLVFNGFVVYYLTDMGYSNTQVGFSLSATMLMGVLGRFFWGYICDVKRTFKKVFILNFIVLIVITNLLRFLDSFYFITLLMAMIGFLQMPQTVVLDTWIMSGRREVADNYGLIRSGGSLGYALVAVVYGKLLGITGWNLMFIAYTFFALTVILIALSLEDSVFVMDEKSKISLRSQFLLLKNKEYSFMLSVSLLIYAPFLATVYYMPVILKNVGGNTFHNGLVLFITAFSEVPALAFSNILLKKYRTTAMILFSSLFFLVKLIILWTAASPTPVILGGLLQALSFAVFLPAIRSHIYKISPENLRASSQSFGEAVYTGLGGIAASALGGFLIDRYGMDAMFISGIVCNALAIILLAAKILNVVKKVASGQAI